MAKIHIKTPVSKYVFNKVAGLYPATSLKENFPKRCLLMNCEGYLRQLFYRTSPGDCFCSTEKYFTNKIEKNLLRKACKKQQHKQNKNLIPIYIKSSYPFTIQNLLISLSSASHDILKTRVCRNNAIPLRINPLQKIISHIRFEK